MTKRIFAAVSLLCILASVASAQSAANVFGWPPADGSISTVKLADLDYLPFNTSASEPAYAEGKLFWDKDNGCPAFYPEVDGPVMQVGQGMWVRVKNAGVATMTNGAVVCLTEPGTGKDPIAVLADASAADTSKIIGVVTADISPDGTGYATIMGLVRDLNTAEFAAGERIYLSATTPGSFTATLPSAPNYSIVVGYVMKAHGTAGSIYVRPWVYGALDRAAFASVLNAATGTAALPAYSFGSDPDTGIYSSAADNLGVSIGGTERMRITSGGNVLIATSTDDGANKLQVNGFTKLGEAATGIKMKVLTGTTAAAEGGTSSVSHGLNSNKIVSWRIQVNHTTNEYIGENYPQAGYQFKTVLVENTINVLLSATESENVLGKPFKILVWYIE